MGSWDDYYDEKWKKIKVKCDVCGAIYETEACESGRHNCIPTLVRRIAALEKLVKKPGGQYDDQRG